jgi:hypothetical protein
MTFFNDLKILCKPKGVHMDYFLIAKVFPLVVFISPYITQFVKLGLKTELKKHPDYDDLVSKLALAIAGLVGVGALYLFGLHPRTLIDWAVAVVTVVVYALGGGKLSQSAYAFVNAYLHQTTPVLPTVNRVGIATPGKLGPEPLLAEVSDTTREPY